ncbi:hypothetical protein [Sorangium sp. So ce1097]|uniref:hypothetical protein n=1 Tax=Sorangium sp. So ce1097 TaxID=3133330 RepID=UPI003F642AB3
MQDLGPAPPRALGAPLERALVERAARARGRRHRTELRVDLVQQDQREVRRSPREHVRERLPQGGALVTEQLIVEHWPKGPPPLHAGWLSRRSLGGTVMW